MPIAHDNAYAELTYDGYVAPSFLAAPDGVEAGIEIYSLSKSLNMPGWRVAFAVGQRRMMLQNLTRLKTNVDSGMFLAAAAHGDRGARPGRVVQRADARDSTGVAATSCARRSHAIGVAVEPPRGGIYVWAPDASRRVLGGVRGAPAGGGGRGRGRGLRRMASSARVTCASR